MLSSFSAEAKSKTVPDYIFWHLSPAEGASPELAAQVEKTLRIYFTKQHKDDLMGVIPMDSLLLITGNEKYTRCGTGAACLAGLGKTAESKYIISGEVSLQKGIVTTTLVLVDIAKQAVVNSTFIKSQGEIMPDQLADLDKAMFDHLTYFGSIEISCGVDGADVYYAGEKVGQTPLIGPLIKMKAGEHLLEVKKYGHQTFSKQIRVPVGKSVRVVALLPQIGRTYKPPPEPFYKDWVFLTTASVGVAAMVAAIFLHLDGNTLENNADVYRRDGNDLLADQSQSKADHRFTQAYIAYGVGGAGLLTSGVLALINIIKRSQTNPYSKPAVELEPMSVPGGAGVSFSWQF
jgi:hypothetical protein